jgi:hypothetical protein
MFARAKREAATVIEVEPVKIGNEHWMIEVTIGGTAMEPRGPFVSASTAEIVAEKMRRIGRALASPSEWR